MCQLLFLLGCLNKNGLIKSFLELSQDEDNKDNKKYLDGFGFASIDHEKKWNVYVNELSYKEAMKKTPDVIENEIMEIAKKDLVVGHLRNKKNGIVSKINTQPFQYENQIFCHNGYIDSFHDDNKKIKNIIMKKIDKKYKQEIKGETDSEYLFFLFLTFKHEIMSEDFTQDGEILTHDDTNVDKGNRNKRLCKQLKTAMQKMIQFLKELNVLIYLNIIYCNDEFAIITRYVIHKKKETLTSHSSTPSLLQSDIAPTLYYNTDNGLIVSSNPISEQSELVKENSFIIIKI